MHKHHGRTASCALIGYLVPDEILERLTKIDPSPAIQTQRFGRVLLDLLRSSASHLRSFNFVPIQDFPIGRQIFFRGGCHAIGSQPINLLPFINLPILKHLTRFLALARRLPELSRFDSVIVHGLHLPNLLIARLLHQFGVRIGVVLTDPQGVILPSDGRVRRVLKRIDRRLAKTLTGGFDFGIALSSELARTYIPTRPVVLLPGIYDDKLEKRIAQSPAHQAGRRFRVVYFGGLTPEYGIQALVEALPMLDALIEVAVFGSGTMDDILAQVARDSPKFIWGGLVDQDRLIEEMRSCDVLINPRPSRGEIAQMSSPSKLIEYAASGKPVMSTRLPSLPPALLESLLIIEDETPSGIAKAINHAASMERMRLQQFGKDFQRAVRSSCSVDALGTSIVRLLQHAPLAANEKPAEAV